MTNPQFPDHFGMREVVRPGATASKAGPDMLQRVAALEQGALGRPGPEIANGSVITSDTSQTGGVDWKPGLAVSNSGSGAHTTANTSTWVDLSSSPSLTVAKTGTYAARLNALIQMTGTGLSESMMGVSVNGATPYDMLYKAANAQWDASSCARTRKLTLAAGDVLTVKVSTNNKPFAYYSVVLELEPCT